VRGWREERQATPALPGARSCLERVCRSLLPDQGRGGWDV